MVILKPSNAPKWVVNAGLRISGLLCILLTAGSAHGATTTENAVPNPGAKSKSTILALPSVSSNQNLSSNLNSQQRAELTVEGTVKDAPGLPMPGVSILLKGTKNAAMTDPAGRFKIVVPDGTGTLVFSYIGYVNREVPINNQSRINIVLAEDSKVLNDVVIIGYGTVKKRDLTGSVSSVKGEDLKNVPAQNVMESIQGKIPGADITRSSGQTGSGVNITLRGNRSLAGSNSPLFVVDGAIYYGNIADIATSDVQSIDVLKDASSTAIYGSRGANGVIIITTKRGANGSTIVSANSYVGISDVSRVPTLATGPEYVAWKREANRAAGRWTSTANDAAIFNPTEIAAIASNTWTDYHDLLIHSGLQQDHQFSVTSGTEKTKIYFSGDFYKEKGIFKLDDLSRYSARMNVDQTISKIFKAGIQAQIVYYKQHLRGDPLNAANKMNPLGSAFDANGNFLLQPIPGGAFSPLSDEQPGVYAGEGRNNRSFGTIYAELTPLAGLSIHSNFTANLFNTRTGYYYGVNSLNRGGSAARSQYNTSGSTDLLFETIVNYNKTIGDHSLTLTAIGGLQNRTADSGSAQGDGQLLGSQIFYGLGGATSGLISNTAYSRQDILSVAGRINYSYKSKYLLTLTGRNDGSSKLTEGSKWTFFPSAAAAWRISEESFMKDNKVISDLKFRASYGVAGNDPYEPYVTQSVLTRNPYSFGEVLAPGYAYSTQIGNPDLRWEKSSTIDLGVDFGILNNRLTGTVDVYNTNTNDLLLPRRLPASSGVSTTVQNVGKTNNKGIELSLTSANVQGKDWTWSTTVTFTKNKEKIKELVTEGVNDIASGLFLGQPIQVYYDYEKLGIWQTSEATEAAKFGQLPGSIRVKDQNGDGKIDATNDRIVLGTSRPKWSGGIDNNVRYKNFDLNVYVFARIGQMIAPDFLGVKTNYAENTAAAGLNYWTPENQSGIYPRPNANGGFLYTSTLNYTNGSFVRIRDITIGYTLPKTLFGGAFKSFRIYANAKNYFTFSSDRIKEYDPERGGSENFPMTKLMTAGINATF